MEGVFCRLCPEPPSGDVSACLICWRGEDRMVQPSWLMIGGHPTHSWHRAARRPWPAEVSEITQSFSAHLSPSFFGVVCLTSCNLDLTVTLYYAEECPVCYIISTIGFHSQGPQFWSKTNLLILMNRSGVARATWNLHRRTELIWRHGFWIDAWNFHGHTEFAWTQHWNWTKWWNYSVEGLLSIGPTLSSFFPFNCDMDLFFNCW